MGNELVKNIGRLHTTEMGEKRISRNLLLVGVDVVQWCRLRILDKKASIDRKGKNWYAQVDGCIITVNAS